MAGFKQISKAEARAHIVRDERISKLDQTVVPLESKDEFISEISRLWGEAQTTFLTIGRYLVQAAEKLEHGQYISMVENELPFGYHTSYQLRMVAEAIDGNVLSIAEVPPSYTTIYQITTLKDRLPEGRQPWVDEAGEEHPPIIRPTVRREEIARFKKHIKSKSPARTEEGRIENLRKRRAALIAQRDRILEKIAEIDREIG